MVAVAFSGGLDSSVVCKCASRHAKVIACAASSEGARDGAKAREAASELGVELVPVELTADRVTRALASLELPFEPTLMDRSLWCLYSLVSRSARDAGTKVILLGQLADELFGGYAKYAEALKAKGPAAVEAMMKADVEEYSLRGKARDFGACARWVQPRLPFESEEVVSFATSLPVSYKIRAGVRKAVLRRAALLLGVPEGLAGAEKKAAQYSSGVQKLVVGSHI